MKKIIPIYETPITSYPAIANILSLMWDKKDTIMSWFSDHFVQIIVRSNHEHTLGEYYDHADIDNHFCTLFGMPWLNWMRINSDVVHFSKLTDYIEQLINDGFCLQPCLDRYYFDFSEYYKNSHFAHSSFIYGYDSDKKQIYVADFWDDGKYDTQIISYDAINKSMNNNYIINIFKYQDAEYKFQLPLLKLSLQDYLDSKDSMHKFEFSNKEYNHGAKFGLDYYSFLIDHVQKNKEVDIRSFHLLYDHKSLMSYRLEYLHSNNYLTDESFKSLAEINNTLIKKSLLLRNSCIKRNLKYSENITNSILTFIHELKQEDEILVKKLLNELKSQ